MTQHVIVHHTDSDSSHDSESTNGVEWPSLLLMKTHPSPLKDDENEVTIQTTGLVVCHTKNITINKHIPSAPTTSHNRKFVLVLHESVGRIEMFWSTNSQSQAESGVWVWRVSYSRPPQQKTSETQGSTNIISSKVTTANYNANKRHIII